MPLKAGEKCVRKSPFLGARQAKTLVTVLYSSKTIVQEGSKTVSASIFRKTDYGGRFWQTSAAGAAPHEQREREYEQWEHEQWENEQRDFEHRGSRISADTQRLGPSWWPVSSGHGERSR